ncbi:hypothetical protein VWZ88_10810 [Phaeobacter sp. JH20_36]|uniref:hypothetical protein n=1 Tax=unclassified Phaeobacter TaxID=2621772 RepID=UPI003A8A77E2
MYEILVWAGAAVSVAGLFGLMWSVLRVMQAKRQKLDDDALRAVIQKVLPYNLGALFLSVIGLMLVMLGLSLG